MFGLIWYRTKVLRILTYEFDYKPAVPGWQTQVFNSLTKQIKNQGGNEYDGAIAFMLVQIASIHVDDDKSRNWKNRMMEKIDFLMPNGKIGKEILSNEILK
jgi:hypothetical protein